MATDININYNASASFDPDNARVLGIPAALLLDKIIRLCKVTPREDGFCWYNHKQFEEETSLKRAAFDAASKKLEEEGIIERKITYIVGTTRSCSHFRIVDARPTSILACSSDKHPVNTINIQLNSSPADAGSPSSKEQFSFDENDVPFDAEVNVVSVKPESNKKRSAKAGVIYSKLCDELGIKRTRDNTAVCRIAQLIDDGLTEEELIDVIRWSKNDEFYSSGGLMARLSNDAIQKAQMEKPKKKNNDNAVGKVVF